MKMQTKIQVSLMTIGTYDVNAPCIEDIVAATASSGDMGISRNWSNPYHQCLTNDLEDLGFHHSKKQRNSQEGVRNGDMK